MSANQNLVFEVIFTLLAKKGFLRNYRTERGNQKMNRAAKIIDKKYLHVLCAIKTIITRRLRNMQSIRKIT